MFHLSPEVIEAVGVEEALFLDGLSRLFHHKALHGIRAPDGKVWVWTTDTDVAERIFPFWTRKTIMRIRTGLIDRGILLSGTKATCATEGDGAVPAAASWWAFADEPTWFVLLHIASGKRPAKVPSRTIKSPKRDIQLSRSGDSSLPLETPDPTPDRTPEGECCSALRTPPPATPPMTWDDTGGVLFEDTATGAGSKERKPSREEEEAYAPATVVLDAVPSVSPSSTTTVAPEPSQPRSKAKAPPSAGAQVWDAYSRAYVARYGTEPIRNAKQNALCSQLAQRLGELAPAVAAFYVGHPNGFYIQNMHALGLCLKDAESLAVQMQRNEKMTATRARQVDKDGALGDSAQRALDRWNQKCADEAKGEVAQ